MKQILNSTREYGPRRKLKLSQYSKMNYQRCIQYISFMSKLQWVNIPSVAVKNRKYEMINIIENDRNTPDLLSKQDESDCLKNQEESN